jgi:hypothetical protein
LIVFAASRFVVSGGFLLVGALCAVMYLGIRQADSEDDSRVPPGWAPMCFLGAIVWCVLALAELTTGFLSQS